jgi:hypothetical protein
LNYNFQFIENRDVRALVTQEFLPSTTILGLQRDAGSFSKVAADAVGLQYSACPAPRGRRGAADGKRRHICSETMNDMN